METSRPYQTMISIVVSVNSSEKCIPEKLIFCSYFLSLAKNILKDLSHNYDSCQQRIQLSSSLHRKRFFAASGFLVLRNIKAKGGIENFEINVENFSHIPDLRRGFSFLFSVLFVVLILLLTIFLFIFSFFPRSDFL